MTLQTIIKQPVIVFDIGGTHFRSALCTVNGKLTRLKKESALSFRRFPNLGSNALKQGLVDYLVNTAREYHIASGTNHVSISLGAALDGRRGIVYGSGPLWGDDVSEFDIIGILRQQAPELQWNVINDVTAGLLHYAQQESMKKNGKLLLLTISTGIAGRTLNREKNDIALDRFGLQGEIGHLPVQMSYQGESLAMECDCGGMNHLAAFASGRGIAQLIKLIAKKNPELWQQSKFKELKSNDNNAEQAFKKSLKLNDKFATTVLSLATQPIADSIRYALTLDPEIDRIVLTGGVVTDLSDLYKTQLLQHLNQAGLYLSSNFEPTIFEEIITMAATEAVNNLLGAAIYVDHRQKEVCHA